jgi:hypothetical protein
MRALAQAKVLARRAKLILWHAGNGTSDVQTENEARLAKPNAVAYCQYSTRRREEDRVLWCRKLARR